MAYLPKNIILGNREFEIVLKRHATSKRITLRIHPLQPQIIINAPATLAARTISAFLQRSHDQLVAYAKILPTPITLNYGATIPIFGEAHQIVKHATSTTASLQILSTDAKIAQHCKARLGAMLKTYAAQQIELLWQSAPFAELTRPTSITLRDPTSRWGSCSSDGKIMLSRRLIFAPEYVARYVIIHECCHLFHMNHSHAFWRLCTQHCPESALAMAWLKKNHRELFRYQL
jgi:predicted metal-dependent hydrolase